jgi:DNA-binding transcriptional ArsR family regulator
MTNQSIALNAAFHALSDPTRRAVVQHLSRGAATVSELAAPFDMALPSFVQHISVLEKSRLISTRKSGRVRVCSLERDNFDMAETWFNELRVQWASRYDNLDNLLTTLNGDNNEA